MAATVLMRVLLVYVAVFTGTVLGLQWPAAYTASGLIYMPYGEISEPFTAYIDSTAGKGRIDYYGGEC